jgi:putative multicomponent Na+:H+ antiporter subunit B
MNPLTSFNLENGYIYALTSLLPLAAMMVVGQANPYHALVMRGILGAVAAMVYSLFGAADVALTEALMGTMLAITLYAIAVRSSLVMRLGVINQSQLTETQRQIKTERLEQFQQLLSDIRRSLTPYHLRLELIPYPDTDSLQQALQTKEVHAICSRQSSLENPQYGLTVRVQRLYEILKPDLDQSSAKLHYQPVTDLTASTFYPAKKV